MRLRPYLYRIAIAGLATWGPGCASSVVGDVQADAVDAVETDLSRPEAAVDSRPDVPGGIPCQMALGGELCDNGQQQCARIFHVCEGNMLSSLHCTCGTDGRWMCQEFEPCQFDAGPADN
jgi:hypothetical protein